ncbi:MAG: G5 domain-containing protein [Christensenellales bacterium]|jgi:3D (Asp-Asp-Asp) domain-containing protein
MKSPRPVGRGARWIWPLFFTLAAIACLTGVAGAAAYSPAEPFAALAAAEPVIQAAEEIAEPVVEEPEPKMTVYVQCAYGFFELTMTEGNVADALDVLGLEYDGNDLVTPKQHVLLEDGIRIEAISREVRTRTETKTIKHKTEKKKDSTLEKGKTKTKQQGKNGTETLVYEEVYEDGKLVSSTLVSQEVTEEPVTEILLVGTKVVDKAVSAPAEISLKNDKRERRGPPKESEIEKVIYVQATAYTHTGNRTATGVMPYVGMIAVNPDQIPYGTKLYVEGYGYGVAGDTGAFRHTDRFQIDLFMDTFAECMRWGRRNNVKVYILK